jgi:formamidopyrimidine-DNA glycosylase
MFLEPFRGYHLEVPELPEVEAQRRLVERHLRGRVLARVATVRDTIVYSGVSSRQFGNRLEGRKVHAVRRKGKHLWLELDQRPWPTFHFGMGGHFEVYQDGAPPRFWKVELETEAGVRLAMTNPRRLGRIRLLHDPMSEPPLCLLGPDPLDELPSLREFAEMLEARRGPIKAVLLDQKFLAGIGNWIADEVLYQARISPFRVVPSLSDAEVTRLRVKIRSVIERAVAVDARSDLFPRSWLFHVRWGKDPQARVRSGGLAFGVVGGRTTAWVPSVQI